MPGLAFTVSCDADQAEAAVMKPVVTPPPSPSEPEPLSDDELAELEAALRDDAAGDTMPGEEFLARLRRPVERHRT